MAYRRRGSLFSFNAGARRGKMCELEEEERPTTQQIPLCRGESEKADLPLSLLSFFEASEVVQRQLGFTKSPLNFVSMYDSYFLQLL